MQVPLDEDDDPELADEWLTKEEATRHEDLRWVRVKNRLGSGAREAEPLDDALTPNYDYRNELKDQQN